MNSWTYTFRNVCVFKCLCVGVHTHITKKTGHIFEIVQEGNRGVIERRKGNGENDVIIISKTKNVIFQGLINRRQAE